MAISVLQTPATGFATTFPVTGVTAGSALMMIIHLSGAGSVTSVSDGTNGAWTFSQQDPGGLSYFEYVFLGSAAGAFTITIAVSGTTIDRVNFVEIGGFAGAPKILGKNINGQSLTAGSAFTGDTLSATNTYQECFATAIIYSAFNSIAGTNLGQGFLVVANFIFVDQACLAALTVPTSNVAVNCTFAPSVSTNYVGAITLWGNGGNKVAWVKV